MPLKTPPPEAPEMNLIPMVDIMFNLIIFFLVGTEFATMERNIGLKVPEVVDRGAALTAAPERKVVNVDREGQISFEDNHVTLAQLAQRLSAAHSQYSDLGIVVRGDGRGRFQEVAEVLNACKQAGIQELAITVRLIAPGE
jgi:biopolymer transport protein ExbD